MTGAPYNEQRNQLWLEISLMVRKLKGLTRRNSTQFSPRADCHGCLVHFVDNKQLLDKVFVISGIMQGRGSVNSRAEGRG